jgi:hypothetical protein
MDFEITGNASFDSVNGTFTWDLPNHIFISGYDSNLLVFNTVNLNGGPPPTFTFTGGADSLTATVNLTKVEDTSPVLIGGYTVDSISGSPEFTSNFGAPGSMGNFSWTLNGNGPGSLGALLVSPGGSFIATPTSTGTLTPVGPPSEVPLPPAVYLFGSVLGGAFWLGRKKRNAVSGLSSA